LLYLPWRLLPPLLLLSAAILTILKNIMKPAKGQSIARLVKTVASVAIALKKVVLAAYAGKKEPRPNCRGGALAFHMLIPI
jgi:hypothetical protein